MIRVVEKVINIDNLMPKNDPLAHLRAFKTKPIDFKYDINDIDNYKVKEEKADAKKDLKIDSFTSLPIQVWF